MLRSVESIWKMHVTVYYDRVIWYFWLLLLLFQILKYFLLQLQWTDQFIESGHKWSCCRCRCRSRAMKSTMRQWIFSFFNHLPLATSKWGLESNFNFFSFFFARNIQNPITTIYRYTCWKIGMSMKWALSTVHAFIFKIW